jgi:hypothetical protein
MKRSVISVLLKADVYARHGREPFGSERLDVSSSTRLKAKGLMGCPFDSAQGTLSLPNGHDILKPRVQEIG